VRQALTGPNLRRTRVRNPATQVRPARMQYGGFCCSSPQKTPTGPTTLVRHPLTWPKPGLTAVTAHANGFWHAAAPGRRRPSPIRPRSPPQRQQPEDWRSRHPARDGIANPAPAPRPGLTRPAAVPAPTVTSGAEPAVAEGRCLTGRRSRYGARSRAIDRSSGRTQAGTPICTYTARACSATAIADGSGRDRGRVRAPERHQLAPA
jgi:hypothetical protein